MEGSKNCHVHCSRMSGYHSGGRTGSGQLRPSSLGSTRPATKAQREPWNRQYNGPLAPEGPASHSTRGNLHGEPHNGQCHWSFHCGPYSLDSRVSYRRGAVFWPSAVWPSAAWPFGLGRRPLRSLLLSVPRLWSAIPHALPAFTSCPTLGVPTLLEGRLPMPVPVKETAALGGCHGAEEKETGIGIYLRASLAHR